MSVKTWAEQIADLEATKKSLTETMQTVAKAASEEGRTMNTAEASQFDDAEAQIKQIDADLSRVKKLAELDKATATPVEAKHVDEASRVLSAVQVKNTEKLEPGIAFARAAKSLALGHMHHQPAHEVAKNLGYSESIVNTAHAMLTKAAVAPATTTNSTWAKPLVDTGGPLADFVEFLRPQTILGKFGNNGIPSLRNIPFYARLGAQTSGGAGYWVGEGNAKPLTKFDFSEDTLTPLKVANIAVATMELLRDSNPAADGIIRDQLAAALTERLDIDFIDPAKVAVAGISPASILNGVTGIPSSGTDAASVRTDVQSLFGAFIAANNAPTSGVWIMDAVSALALGMMQNPLGQSEFPGMGMNGGTFQGLPVIVSQYLPRDSSGGVVALVNASDIYVADEGGIDLAITTEASLQMDDNPDNPTSATTVLVSLFQRNLVGFRAERAINWKRRRASAVAYLTGVNWGA